MAVFCSQVRQMGIRFGRLEKDNKKTVFRMMFSILENVALPSLLTNSFNCAFNKAKKVE